MYRISPKEDIHSISDFRANSNTLINQIKKTKRPLILTQHGKSSAILLDVTEYEKLIDEIELLHDLQSARKELNEGKGIAHEEIVEIVKEKFSK